jgi:putative ATP-dependent endonuclease of OLD family
MFFAQGLILVEGSAEQLIIPQVAKLIGCPLSKKGVSLINVNSTAFLRYSRIFVRSDGEDFDMPVSCITDCDVKPQVNDNDLNYNMSDLEKEIAEKEAYYTDGKVVGFVSPFWTLEYVLALSSLKEEFYKAVLYAKKIQNSNKVSLTPGKIETVDKEVAESFQLWEKQKRDKHWIAYEIYHNEVLKNKISKAIIAQCFASSLEYNVLKNDDKITKDLMFDVDLSRKQYDNEKVKKLRKQIIEDNELKYLVSAIEYASRIKKIEDENE